MPIKSNDDKPVQYIMISINCHVCCVFCNMRALCKLGLKRKRFFPFSRKAKIMRKWANFHENIRFLRSFCKNGYVSAINIFKMINSNGNLTILVHVHCCGLICFEAPSGFDNFEVNGGQYCCPICFEAPSWVDNREVHVHYCCPICFEAPSWVDNREVHFHYCCPICFEAPSGFDIWRYFTIFPVSCVRFLIHFRFRENFRYFCNFS
jgi:hypothetical protein